MIGQQRQILTDLGIDLWIPRDVACQNFNPASIWRDQSTEQIAELRPVVAEPQAPTLPQATAAPIAITPPVRHLETKANVTTAEVQVQPEIQVQAEVTLKQPSNFTHFELQLLNLAHCAIVIDASQLSQDAKQLWANINQALQAEYQQLNWPFPLLNLQDGNGAQSYVEGFLDAHSVDKQLISLGDLPYSHTKILKLPSLNQMLAQPLLKKRLWQLIQNNKQG